MATNVNCLDLVQSYISYLNQDFVISDYEENGCHLITPFWRPDGDHIEIFALENTDGFITLTDEGQTLDWLFSVGFEIQGHKKREELVNQLVKLYGVELKNEIISIRSDYENIGTNIHRFLNALNALSYVILLRQQRGKPTFRDEVELYLRENGQDYKSNVKVPGRTVEHTIPFYLNSRRNWLVEVLSANVLSSARDALYKVTFEWTDIRGANQPYQMVTLVDDTDDKWEQIWSRNRIKVPLETYSDRVIRWSQRTQLLGSLA